MKKIPQRMCVGCNTKKDKKDLIRIVCNKEGEIFVTNFIGDNLFFTNYELTQQKAYQNAKPTNMDKVDENNPDESDSDINLDDIEL